MNNREISRMTEKEFFTFYNQAISREKEKKAINTATLTLDKQLKRFIKASFTEDDEKAIYQDALSV